MFQKLKRSAVAHIERGDGGITRKFSELIVALAPFEADITVLDYGIRAKTAYLKVKIGELVERSSVVTELLQHCDSVQIEAGLNDGIHIVLFCNAA